MDVYAAMQNITGVLPISIGLFRYIMLTKDSKSFYFLEMLPREKQYDNMKPESHACVCVCKCVYMCDCMLGPLQIDGCPGGPIALLIQGYGVEAFT